MKHVLFLFTVVLILLAACAPKGTSASPSAPPEATTQPPPPTDTPTLLEPMTLTSAAFANEGDIPARYGQKPFSIPHLDATFVCTVSQEGQENVSLPLIWTNVPREAKSLVLLMGDQMNYAYPEAPADAVFSHWVVYNIPPSSTGLPEGVPAELTTLADGSMQGVNNYPGAYQAGYGGPCPGPNEKHLYVFTLYALDTVLDLPPGAEMDNVKVAMEGHILAQAELKGYFLDQ